MEAQSIVPPLVVLAGPTASGKTSLAITIAEHFNGEIICADSRTVYKYMDIGTAKPSAEEQERVKHWGLDLVEPGEEFNAAMFKKYAIKKITEIRARGKVPIIAGGTGLYVDAIIFDYKFGTAVDDTLRHRLEAMTIEQLHDHCYKNNMQLPENSLNKRYVIREIERKGLTSKRRTAPIGHSIIVGIATKKDILRTRIEHRAEQLFTNGMVEEAKMLGKKYGWNNEAMTGNIYPLVKKYIEGELSKSELQEKFVTSDWRLAKRQMTWLKRNSYILWLTLKDAEHYLSQKLVDYHNS